MKKIKTILHNNNNKRLSKFFNMKNPVDRVIFEKIKAGELTVCIVDLEKWQCEICGAENSNEEKYCWFCEHAK